MFAAVEGHLAERPEGTEVLFTLQPHELVRDIRIKGNFLMLESELARLLRLRSAEPFSDEIVRGDVERMLRYYEELGYEGTMVDPEISRESGEVRVTYRIGEGRPRVVQEVLLRGSHELGRSEILGALGVRRNSFYRGSDLQRRVGQPAGLLPAARVPRRPGRLAR